MATDEISLVQDNPEQNRFELATHAGLAVASIGVRAKFSSFSTRKSRLPFTGKAWERSWSAVLLMKSSRVD